MIIGRIPSYGGEQRRKVVDETNFLTLWWLGLMIVDVDSMQDASWEKFYHFIVTITEQYTIVILIKCDFISYNNCDLEWLGFMPDSGLATSVSHLEKWPEFCHSRSLIRSSPLSMIRGAVQKIHFSWDLVLLRQNLKLWPTSLVTGLYNIWFIS